MFVLLKVTERKSKLFKIISYVVKGFKFSPRTILIHFCPLCVDDEIRCPWTIPVCVYNYILCRYYDVFLLDLIIWTAHICLGFDFNIYELLISDRISHWPWFFALVIWLYVQLRCSRSFWFSIRFFYKHYDVGKLTQFTGPRIFLM